jgi:Calx-beta domain/PASTA domain
VGETTKVVHVQILDCPVAEHLERFSLRLFNNSFISRPSTDVAIVDNDTVVASPSIGVHDVVVDEQAGSAFVTVLLDGYEGQASASTVTVHYATSDGAATGGADYTAANDTLSFAPGQVAKTVAVPILDDGLPEAAEDFALSLSGATGGATIGDGTARTVIGPSDAPATAQPFVSAQPDVVIGESEGLMKVVVSLSAPGLNPVSVDWILDDGTAAGGTACDKDYVSDRDNIKFLPGETTKVVYVQILDCALVEGFETFTLDLFNNTKLAKGSTLLTVVDRTVTLNNIEVTPANPTAAKGTNTQFSATGTYSNTVSLDLTSTVVWASLTPTVATVGAGLFDSGGLAHAANQGTSTTATLGAFTHSTLLTVGPPVLAGISVTPASPTVVTAAEQQFTATGNLTDGTTTDLTGAANWSSATQTVATIAASGQAHAVGVGTSLISASFGGFTGSTTLTVGKANQAITVTAHAPATAAGGSSFSVAASAPGGSVSYLSAGACTNSGSFFSAASAGGVCTVRYDQAGNASYNAAPQVTESVTVGAAKLALKSRHCRTGTVQQAYSKKVKKGIVISQSRRAGQKLPANTKINLVVSKGRAPVVATSGAGQLKAVVDRLETILQGSAASRRTLAAALTAGFRCSAPPRATVQRVAAVVAARRALLRQLRSVKAPAPLLSLLRLLDQAFQQSITADGYYRAGFLAIGSPEAGCPLPRNASFQLAAKADARATTLKRQFVARFNPLAGRYHRATWKPPRSSDLAARSLEFSPWTA